MWKEDPQVLQLFTCGDRAWWATTNLCSFYVRVAPKQVSRNSGKVQLPEMALGQRRNEELTNWIPLRVYLVYPNTNVEWQSIMNFNQRVLVGKGLRYTKSLPWGVTPCELSVNDIQWWIKNTTYFSSWKMGKIQSVPGHCAKKNLKSSPEDGNGRD